MSGRRWCVVLLVAAPMAVAACGSDGLQSRRAEVRRAGSTVMPFGLDATRHSFVKTGDGGIETVIAIDPSDAEQIGLVRGHLRELRADLAAGRFADPVAVHGADMPGVQGLAAGADRLRISYRDVEAGGELTFRTSDGAMVVLLHDWFDAQLRDHGSDASSMPFGHVMTEEMRRAHHPDAPPSGSGDG